MILNVNTMESTCSKNEPNRPPSASDLRLWQSDGAVRVIDNKAEDNAPHVAISLFIKLIVGDGHGAEQTARERFPRVSGCAQSPRNIPLKKDTVVDIQD